MTNGKITVLVVDDEALLRLAMATDLSDSGFEVRQAHNAAAAIAEIEADGRIDAVVTDIRMPGDVDGLALMRTVGRRWPDIAVFLTSGAGSLKQADLPCGVRYFAKPCDIRQIAAAIRERVAEPVA